MVSDQRKLAGAIELTNDGATILRSIGVDNPAAKILVGNKIVLSTSILLLLNGDF